MDRRRIWKAIFASHVALGVACMQYPSAMVEMAGYSVLWYPLVSFGVPMAVDWLARDVTRTTLQRMWRAVSKDCLDTSAHSSGEHAGAVLLGAQLLFAWDRHHFRYE